ncbi:unnamed protein product [Aphanomyces euteiches]
MGKPPASQELKKALDPTFYSSCSDLSASLPRNTAIQTVAAYMASKPSLHLGGDLLQHPIAVVGMGAVHDDVAAFLVPFLNAFFDVTAFQAAPPIPAFAASRLRLLRLPQSYPSCHEELQLKGCLVGLRCSIKLCLKLHPGIAVVERSLSLQVNA